MFMKDSINPTYEMTPGFNLSQYRCNVTFFKHVFPLVIPTEKGTFLFAGVSSWTFFERTKVHKLRHQVPPPVPPVLDQPPSVTKGPINN